MFKIEIEILYEHTDHSGLVYHPNYFKFFQAAREKVVSADVRHDLWHKKGIGFSLHKIDNVLFKAPATYGDIVIVSSVIKREGKYKLIWNQSINKKEDKQLLVTCTSELVCLTKDGKLETFDDIPVFGELN